MTMDMKSQTEEVLFDRAGTAAIIRLNRPKVLNSLTLGMVRSIAAGLDRFARDPHVACVIIAGEGERGFCAGGDIRMLADNGKTGSPGAATFWREEFRLNHMIAHYRKPYVAFMDGITMGGGVGLSAHGSHRVVTERTRLAMPETGIGYFTDVGATWLLPRAPGETGTWMGLTGKDVGAADAIHAGLADHFIPSGRLPDVVRALSSVPRGALSKHVSAVLETFTALPGESALGAAQTLIDSTFGFDRVEDIVDALARQDGEFARQTADTLITRSPTSLKLVLRLLRLGRASASLDECLEREFAAAQAMLGTADFYEGVRAAIIDKDRNPRWKPARLEEVSAAALDRFFPKVHPLLFPHNQPNYRP